MRTSNVCHTVYTGINNYIVSKAVANWALKTELDIDAHRYIHFKRKLHDSPSNDLSTTVLYYFGSMMWEKYLFCD